MMQWVAYICLLQNGSVQLCGSDGKFYSSECEMRAESCSLRQHINVVEPQHCGDDTNNYFIKLFKCFNT